MQVTIVTAPNVTVNPPKGKGRAWKKMEVLYRTVDGKVSTKILVSFTNPTVFEQFEKSKVGEVYEVETVKGEPNAEGRSFWEWKSAHAVGAADIAPQEAPAVATPTVAQYQPTEAPVTRAPVKVLITEVDRQRSIVRQSSLAQAVASLGPLSAGVSVVQVLGVAAQYEAWVNRPVEDVQTPAAVAPVVVETAAKPRGRPRKPEVYQIEPQVDQVEVV